MLDRQNNVNGFYLPTILGFIGVGFCLWMFYVTPIEYKTTNGTMEIWIPKKISWDRYNFCGYISKEKEGYKIPVSMYWDATRGRTEVRMCQMVIENPDKLEETLLSDINYYRQTGKPVAPSIETTYGIEKGGMVIDIKAEPKVPWQDVVSVVDICKKLNIAVEFDDYPPFKYEYE